MNETIYFIELKKSHGFGFGDEFWELETYFLSKEGVKQYIKNFPGNRNNIRVRVSKGEGEQLDEVIFIV